MPRQPATSLYFNLLRASLAVGGLYDLVLAAWFLLAPGSAARLLRLPPPDEAVYVWLIVVLLAMVAALYLLAAYDPMAYAGNVLVAIAGRAVGGSMLLYAAGRGLPGLYLPGAVDLLFAAVHAVCWWPLRRLRAQLL